jgi:hypothetical protein
VLLGGVMMAKPAAEPRRAGDQDHRRHHRAARGARAHPAPQRALDARQRIGRSACDQCRFCTEFCPRFLLGHPIEPHRAMQSLGFSTGADAMVATLYCCECNLCTMFACPEDLDPKTVCVQAQTGGAGARAHLQGHARIDHAASHGRVPPRAHAPPDRRLGLGEFNNTGPLTDHAFAPRKVNSRSSNMPARRRLPWSSAATACVWAICSPRRKGQAGRAHSREHRRRCNAILSKQKMQT